jgi:hypothetical protein
MMTLLAQYEYESRALVILSQALAASERGDAFDFLRSPCGVAD